MANIILHARARLNGRQNQYDDDKLLYNTNDNVTTINLLLKIEPKSLHKHTTCAAQALNVVTIESVTFLSNLARNSIGVCFYLFIHNIFIDIFNSYIRATRSNRNKTTHMQKFPCGNRLGRILTLLSIRRQSLLQRTPNRFHQRKKDYPKRLWKYQDRYRDEQYAQQYLGVSRSRFCFSIE